MKRNRVMKSKMSDFKDNQLTGNIGLYYICYELSKRGWNALPTSRNFLLGVLVLGLFTTSFGVQTVKASPIVMVDQPWYRVTGVNQPVEFTASASGGTPPYTFQWCTTFLDSTVSPEQWKTVTVPDSNSSTFKFVASTPGRYGISIRLSDSKGDDEYQSFQPIGIVVTVQSSPIPQSTPSPSPSPSSTPSPATTLTPTPSIPEFPSWTITVPLSIMVAFAGLLVYFKKRKH
jgi:hypothetical protein